ncbi:hypothetical protein AB3X91_14840 [Paraburkholderia sp. BR14263]|uniref:hypothetical protein n=1 Tax=unclassified Paraburkholderia TaxID=2615204 RepID=UPI0034CD8F95
MTHVLDREIAAFEAQEAQLLAHHLGKFVVFCDGRLQGSYDTFDTAFRSASAQFGTTPFLVRQVGVSSTFPVPASVAYRPIAYAHR